MSTSSNYVSPRSILECVDEQHGDTCYEKVVSKWAECTGSSSRAPKDSSSNNKRQHPVSGAKRTILSRMDGKSNGTPQRVGRKKSKYASSPTRSTLNSRLK